MLPKIATRKRLSSPCASSQKGPIPQVITSEMALRDPGIKGAGVRISVAMATRSSSAEWRGAFSAPGFPFGFALLLGLCAPNRRLRLRYGAHSALDRTYNSWALGRSRACYGADSFEQQRWRHRGWTDIAGTSYTLVRYSVTVTSAYGSRRLCVWRAVRSSSCAIRMSTITKR